MDIEEKDIMRTGDKLRFMTDIIRKQTDLGRQIEARANITLGFSAALLTYSLNTIRNNSGAGMIFVGVSATVAVVLSFMALKPPKILSNRHQKQSVFYHTAISSKTSDEYISEIKKISSNLDEVLEQYSLEIYNLTKHSIHHKKKFAHLAIQVLTFGFILEAAYLIIRYTL